MEKNFSGKTLEEAIEKASLELQADKDDFTYEIVEYPNKGFLGIGAKPAVIRVNIGEEEEEVPAKKEAAPKTKPAKQPKVQEEKKPEETPVKTFEPDREILLVIENYVRGLMEKMAFDEYGLKVEQVDEKVIQIRLGGENVADLTKKQGEIIDSMQLMIALMLNKKTDKYYKLNLDVNDYKKRSVSRLESLAVKTAKQVLKSHRKVTLRAMSAYQRRVIHSRLQDFQNITTYSIGEEPNRRVVIAYQNGEKKA